MSGFFGGFPAARRTAAAYPEKLRKREPPSSTRLRCGSDRLDYGIGHGAGTRYELRELGLVGGKRIDNNGSGEALVLSRAANTARSMYDRPSLCEFSTPCAVTKSMSVIDLTTALTFRPSEATALSRRCPSQPEPAVHDRVWPYPG